jgi:hypothetical protein
MTPLITEAGTLLPPDLRAELSIVNVTADSPSRIRFRLDPGHMFLLRGQLRSWEGRLTAGIWVQYRPHEQLTWVATAPMSPSGLGQTLRELTGHAIGYVPGAHWLDIYHQQAPAWICSCPPKEFDQARSSLIARARQAGVACYLWYEANELITGNNPPPSGPFFSVTPIAEWSLHNGRRTRPLETNPDMAAVDATISLRLARLAARDRRITELAAPGQPRQQPRPAPASRPRRHR